METFSCEMLIANNLHNCIQLL